MISAEDIKKKEFSKAGMSGYKKIEVDVFLDEIANTLNYLAATQAANEKKISDYELKLNEYKNDEQAIKEALINAQRLSDQLRAEAQQKADDILFKANQQAEEILTNANNDAEFLLNDSKEKANIMLTEAQSLSKELSDKTERMTRQSIDSTERKVEAMKKAAEDAVKQQQSLFDALRIQVSVFKRDILKRLSEQTEFVTALPDEIEYDPSLAAKMAEDEVVEEVSETVDTEACNDIERIIKEMKLDEQTAIEFSDNVSADITEDITVDEYDDEIFIELGDAVKEQAVKPANFTVNIDFDDDTEDNADIEETTKTEAEQISLITETGNEKESQFVFDGDISDAEE